MAQVALITVHGMGETLPNYADGLMASVRARLGTVADQAVMRSVYYQKILQDNQQLVWDRTRSQSTVRYEDLL